MNPKEYNFQIIHNNAILGQITVNGYEDNARWLAYKKLQFVTNINPSLIDLKLI